MMRAMSAPGQDGQTKSQARRDEARSGSRRRSYPIGHRRNGGTTTHSCGSSIANSAAVDLLPFDRHHLIGQFGGAVLALTGLRLGDEVIPLRSPSPYHVGQ